MAGEGSFNRLKSEKSMYLKQHQDNPIHWYSYCPEAIQKAKDENKPIFLSVGYSSCHWCHVMSQESFSNNDVADFLNKNFISIKVDKEEFPDIDSYYQQACQLFSQSGGWPLSAFLLPDMKPFFVGTYYPLVSQNKNETTFPELIGELNRAYSEERDKVEENANKVTEALKEGFISKEKVEFQGHFPQPMSILEAISEFKDKENGGYGEAPKFPNFSFYEWAIEQMIEGMVSQEEGEHIIKSIETMMMGGIYDQVRGGIHRYSVDKEWKVPHFEKMLYDQAGLLKMLTKLSLIFPSPLIFDGIMDTLDYLEKEMLSEEKYFFSAQDADSEGMEGAYFTFSKEEFEDSLNRGDDKEEVLGKHLDQLKKWFNITDEGNFHSGLNVISLNLEEKENLFSQKGWNLIRKAKESLLSERRERIPPQTDRKGVASWNFMIMSALVDTLQYTQIPAIRHKASLLFNKALEGIYKNFLNENNKTPNGINLVEGKTIQENTTSIRHTNTLEEGFSFIEDYVFFAEAQVRIYEVTGNPVFKENFKDTLTFIEKEFIDEGSILTRPKSLEDLHLYPNQKVNAFDNSYRSPTSTLIGLFRRAAILFLDKDYLEIIEKIKEISIHESLKNPIGSGEALRSLTYPDDVYRVVKVPVKWLNEADFASFINFFQHRFVLDFHNENNEEWQICNMEACELQGEGLKNFLGTLSPKEEKEEE